jgi:hypothetical protein
MSATNFAHSARFVGAWLVLATLTMALGLQLLAQLRELWTARSLAAPLCTSAEAAPYDDPRAASLSRAGSRMRTPPR